MWCSQACTFTCAVLSLDTLVILSSAGVRKCKDVNTKYCSGCPKNVNIYLHFSPSTTMYLKNKQALRIHNVSAWKKSPGRTFLDFFDKMITGQIVLKCFHPKCTLPQPFLPSLFSSLVSSRCSSGSSRTVTCFSSFSFIHTWCCRRCSSFQRTDKTFHTFSAKSTQNFSRIIRNVADALFI